MVNAPISEKLGEIIEEISTIAPWAEQPVKERLQSICSVLQEQLAAFQTFQSEAEQQKTLLELSWQQLDLQAENHLEWMLNQAMRLLQGECGFCVMFDPQYRIEKTAFRCFDAFKAYHIDDLPIAEELRQRALEERRPILAQSKLDQSTAVCIPLICNAELQGMIYLEGNSALTQSFEQHCLIEGLSRTFGCSLYQSRLQTTEKFRSSMLIAMSREAYTPMSVIDSLSEELFNTPPTTEEVREIGHDLSASARRISHLLHDALEINDSSDFRMGSPQKTDMYNFLVKHIQAFAVIAQSHDCQIKLHSTEEPCQVETLPQRLSVVLNQLLHCLLRVSTPNSTIQIWLSSRNDIGPESARNRPLDACACLFNDSSELTPDENSRFIEVNIQNSALHIPTKLLDKLFQPFAQALNEPQPLIHDLGQGLALTVQCIRSLGGCIWITSAPQIGTNFHFTVPTHVVTRLDDARSLWQ